MAWRTPDALRVPHSRPVSRRAVLASAAVGAGLAASRSANANPQGVVSTQARSQTQAKSVIVIFNCGAPSHIDLWDPKPDAADNIRGPFAPIDTNVAGMRFTELLPQMARQAHRLAVVRSVYHEHSSHNSGMYWSIVGRPYRTDNTLINPSPADYPSFGTLLGWLAQKEGYACPLPPYVITPAPHRDSDLYLTPGQYGGCLGRRFDPFVLNADPNSPTFSVPNLGLADGVSTERVALRRDLWTRLDREGATIATELASDLEINHQKAMTLMATGAGGEAFDLSRESPQTRDRYGRHSWGQSHLLARRLIEAGVRVVTTVNGPSITWDTHKDNETRLKRDLVPPMERAYSALLDDLDARGLLESTLVVWMSDFGRTPLINGDAGRDHWPHCYSMVLAGGGIRGGQIVGESDKIGGRPLVRPVSPADIHATIFAALGYNSRAMTYTTADGRPTPVSEGTVIRELLA